MKDEDKTKEQLIDELAVLRQRITELEALELERKRAEEALRESEEKHRLLVENSNEAIVVAQDGMLKFFNPKAMEITGHSQEELASKPFAESIHPDDLEMAVKYYLECLKGEETPQIYALRVIDKDGNTKWVESNAVLITWEGRPATLNFLTDITERKRAEEALCESEERYRSLFEGAEDHIFVVDQDFRYMMVNASALKAGGFTLEDVVGKGPRELFPEDAEFYLSQYRHAFETGEPVWFERELRLLDGLHWFSVKLSPIKDARGCVIALTGISRDITERKRAEEALRASQEYARNIIDSSLDMIIAVDMDRHIVEFNKAAQETFGYRLEEVVGKHVDMLYADPREGLRIHETTIEKGQYAQKILDRRKNGQVFPAFLSASVLRDARGELVGVMGVARDITERKRAEEALRRRNRELALLNRAGQAFSSTLNLDQVLATVLEEVRRLLDVVACSVWLTEPKTEELVCRQAVGPQSEIVRGWRLTLGEGLAGWVARSGESLIVPDTRADERHFKEVDRQTGLALRSILTVPLRVRQDVIGVIQAVDSEVGRFSPTDLTLLEPLAASAAIAVENARLFEREREQRELSEALEEAAAAVSSTLDLDQVLDRILDQVERVVAGDAFSVILIEEDAARLARWLGYELPEEKTQPSRFEIPITKYPNVMKMARTGEPVVVPDTLADPDWVPAARDRRWRRSYVGAPIQVDGLTVGFLNVSGTRPGQFGPADARWLETFASHAAIAIGNALLYEQALEDAETKATLLREVNHRVQNNLTAIVGLLYAERRRAGMEDQAVYQSLIHNLANRVQSLTRVHSLLSASEWTPLLLSELTSQVISSSLQVLPPHKRVSVEVSPSPVRVTSDQAHSLALVINELATNTVKHALQERNTAQIAVRIALEDDTVLFEYRDDGPGYPEEVLRMKRHNVGFDLIQKMVRDSLRGELSLHNDHGAVAVIQFKAKA